MKSFLASFVYGIAGAMVFVSIADFLGVEGPIMLTVAIIGSAVGGLAKRVIGR